MQQIERYGVIALVFLLVTIVAVSFWGDNKSPGFWSRLTGHTKKDEVAKVDAPPNAQPGTFEKALDGNAPLNTTSAPETTPAGGSAAQQPVPAPNESLAVTSANPAPNGGPGTVFNGMPSATTPQPASNSPLAPIGYTPPPAHETMHTVAPVAPVAGGAPSAADARTYTVQKGDSLALIARRTLGSEQRWTEIQDLNNGLDPRSLKIGMRIKLPANAAGATGSSTARVADATKTKTTPAKLDDKAAKVATPAKSTTSARYTIQRGDTLLQIAEKKLGSRDRVKDILAINPGLDARRLVVGKAIKLPGTIEKAPLVAETRTTPVSTHTTAIERPRVR